MGQLGRRRQPPLWGPPGGVTDPDRGWTDDSWQDDGLAGMGVELPKLLSVFAHELRGPLTVLQGYLRLMLGQRGEADAETPMIRAMLDATGRLAALGRQASEVARWCGPAGTDGSVTVATLAEKITVLLKAERARITLEDRAGHEAVRSSDPEALAAALAILAESTARDADGPVEVAGRCDPDSGTVAFLLTPVGGARPRPSDANAGSARPAAVAFDRGGFGLSLVLASYVLDAHGARVLVAGAPGSIEVRLQQAGGST